MKQQVKYYMAVILSAGLFMGAAVAKDHGSWVVGPTFAASHGKRSEGW